MKIRVNGEEQVLDGVATLADLIAVLELAGKRVAIEKNGEIVPRSRHGEERLSDGDELEIVVAVGGG
ncbi:sulfur carrier protein ThiS [Pseudogulbenkiania ferrooxidans]|uniref:Thiamine biosynthesis protein ThiS n=1 Tax=Pseudogulbenkiania ferrooxidans 2002 TaxID=279714 RepID=B9YZF9_9NEIS|nr:sulfur carrier protein ThiS [Pseudogulbenkiania ferrooxidans]EEG10512.1 thiamine biosynthesis protein ThiS [Pseudogulbenkiania ferrooxidans 2002]